MKIRVGVVGCGLVAQIAHLPYLQELSHLFEISALCDLSPGLIGELGRRYDVPGRYQDYRELLEHDLDAQERRDLDQRLSYVAENAAQPDLAHLARELQAYLASETLNIAPQRSTLIDHIGKRIQTFDQDWLTRSRFRAALAGGLLALGLVALANMLQTLPIGPMMGTLERILERLVIEGQLNGSSSLSFFLARLALETFVGLLLMIAAGFLIAGKDRMGVSFGYLGLLLSLTTVNLLVFYFDQFSTIVTASVQFAIFLGLSYYRRKYLSELKAPDSVEDYQEDHPH